jgi:hypothetical protein
MAKPNYQHMKKQREAQKKARQQEKLARKQTRTAEPGEAGPGETPGAPAGTTPDAPKS